MPNGVFFVILHRYLHIEVRTIKYILSTKIIKIMIVFNTTFSIHESITDKCLKYIQTQYIPNMLDDGFTNPLLLKIHNESTDGYHNYAIQFCSPSLEFIRDWKKVTEKEYVNEIRTLFEEKALTFSTIMETI